MKRSTIQILPALIGGLISLMGCTPRKVMPEAELVSVELTRSGTMAGYQYKGHAEADSTGGFVLQAMKEYYGPLYEKRIGKEEMAKFRQIIMEEKMYKYKDSYTPMMRVLDGRSWHFEANFADGTRIYSHGENASPRGEGLERIQNLMDDLIKDGILLESPDSAALEL